MSVCVISLTPEGAVIGVDNKHTETQGDYSKLGVEKTLIRTFNNGPVVIAFAGDAKIGNKMVIDILAAAKHEEASPTRILHGAILRAYAADVATHPWESEEDKKEFLENASVTLACLDSPTHCVISQIGPNVNYIHSFGAPDYCVFGVKDVEERLFKAESIKEALNMIGSAIADICQKHPRCGLPAKIIIWQQGNDPGVRWVESDHEMRHLASPFWRYYWKILMTIRNIVATAGCRL